MQSKLRELAERWLFEADNNLPAVSPARAAKLEDADELLSILDAEGDGGAVAWQSKRRPEDYSDEWKDCTKGAFDIINRTKGSPWITRELFDHPARSGVVSDAEVEAVIKSMEHVNTDGMDGDSWDRILVRAALEHFAKRSDEDVRDAERYRVLRMFHVSGSWPREFENQGISAPAGVVAWSKTDPLSQYSKDHLDDLLDSLLGYCDAPENARADFKEWRASETKKRIASAQKAIDAAIQGERHER